GQGRQAERLEPELVARPLMVGREAGTGMSDLVEPAGKLGRCRRRTLGRDGMWARRLVGRQQRIDREDVLDVHQDQFLMLLLVMQAQFDEQTGLTPYRLA